MFLSEYSLGTLIETDFSLSIVAEREHLLLLSGPNPWLIMQLSSRYQPLQVLLTLAPNDSLFTTITVAVLASGAISSLQLQFQAFNGFALVAEATAIDAAAAAGLIAVNVAESSSAEAPVVQLLQVLLSAKTFTGINGSIRKC